MTYTPRQVRETMYPRGPLCCYCGVSTTRPNAGGDLRNDSYAQQHIMPQRRWKALKQTVSIKQYRAIKYETNPTKDCCYACNQTLALVDDCPGAMACWIGIAAKLGLPATSSGAKRALRRHAKKSSKTSARARRKNRRAHKAA